MVLGTKNLGARKLTFLGLGVEGVCGGAWWNRVGGELVGGV